MRGAILAGVFIHRHLGSATACSVGVILPFMVTLCKRSALINCKSLLVLVKMVGAKDASRGNIRECSQMVRRRVRRKDDEPLPRQYGCETCDLGRGTAR